jgi:hypothetical protein
MSNQTGKKIVQKEKIPELHPDMLVDFLFDLVKEISSFLIELGETEKKYNISLESFGKIFQGEPFRIIVKEMEPKKLGLFMQFIMELAADDSLGFSDIDKLKPDEKITRGKKLQQSLKSYDGLRKQLKD